MFSHSDCCLPNMGVTVVQDYSSLSSLSEYPPHPEDIVLHVLAIVTILGQFTTPLTWLLRRIINIMWEPTLVFSEIISSIQKIDTEVKCCSTIPTVCSSSYTVNCHNRSAGRGMLWRIRGQGCWPLSKSCSPCAPRDTDWSVYNDEHNLCYICSKSS